MRGVSGVSGERACVPACLRARAGRGGAGRGGAGRSGGGGGRQWLGAGLRRNSPANERERRVLAATSWADLSADDIAQLDTAMSAVLTNRFAATAQQEAALQCLNLYRQHRQQLDRQAEGVGRKLDYQEGCT